MHILLAEDIGGWLAAGLLLLGGVASTVLALGALYPASKGMRSLVITLIAPAVIMTFLTTCYLAQAYTHRSSHDREEILINYVQPWFFMAFPPLAASVLVGSILVWKRRQKKSRMVTPRSSDT